MNSLVGRGLMLWMVAGAAGSAQQYPFLPVAGSPKSVQAIFQDSRGRLWLGGPQLTCFDGTRFFSLADYGFPSAQTYDIAEDPSGAIWIGAETGVYRFANGRVEQLAQGVAISVIAARPDIAIANVGPLGKGIPGTDSALIRIQRIGKEWKTETVMDLHSPGPLTLDHGGQILFPWMEHGWYEMRLADVLNWHAPGKVPVASHKLWKYPQATFTRILRDSMGCIWIGSFGQNSDVCNDGILRTLPYRLQDHLSEGLGANMLLAGDNILALGRPDAWQVAKLANGLPTLLFAMQARDGTIWLGGTGGLFRFPSPFHLEYWSPREGVDAAWCLARRGGDLYAGIEHDVSVLTKDRVRWQKIASFDSDVLNLLPAEDGSLLAALDPEGIAAVRPDGTIVARGYKPGYYGLRLAKAENEVWLGGLALGLVKRTGNRFEVHHHALDTKMYGNVLDVQYEQRTRKLWACSTAGLTARNEDGAWMRFTTKEGLLVDPCWSLAALPNGDVWYGYYTTPAFALLRPGSNGRYSVRQYRAGDELLDPESLTFDPDSRGWLWRGGHHGISVADPAEADAARWIHFDQADGFPADAVNSGSFFADTDGSLWWGSDFNIAHYTPPADLVHPTFAPQVFLSAFSWDNNPPRLAEAVRELPHGVKITAHVGSLQFDRRSALRIRYRLLPDQPAWRETKSLDVALGKLATGSHTIEVQGRVFTGPWSGTVSRSFTVLRPVALGWPFLAAYLLAATGLATGGYWMHRRRKAEEAALLPDLAAWRMGALLPDVHDLSGGVLNERFEVGELLARGGFANVFRGYDRAQQQACAVKVFRGELKDKAWMERRFVQEVAALQRVRHENVVTIYAHGAAPSGAPYLVMEYVEGRNLREVLEGGGMAARRVAAVVKQLASALDAIHALGICHRDVKPENIILRHEGAPEEQAVLIDFSIAIVKDADETLYGLSRAAGSFDYMAPEQAVGYAEASSDIYSLAKLAIEMLTGQRLKELLPDAALDLPDRVRELLSRLEVKLSAESIHMMATALEFDPAKRPRAAGGFAGPLVHDLES